ncbi:hypothetical protein BN873_490020 [Candidatus Competibacter denitrificans Run_A_D11]|uniref:YscD cytoplasmic domain-containing protein n=1 Tax=Candidatus Competibacter denitrificans Run_A_D11 TaxID=1400863 RepID=W6M657_9GAMM|nr:type III secretion system inner membrane ring subunit SctD [Candidatus Competibacter denitrificans]CDI03411.1 hypothetical protein BN873_490020 [Candidatus Competibacter denitrificans Run_A_D11]
MSDSRRRFILKFFSGPHAGAEVLLPPGDYVLGGAESCEIVLHDAAVAPRHARLRLSATEIQLSPLERPVTVAGRPIEDETSLGFCQLATLGTTHFAVAPEGEPWEPITLPDLAPASAPPTLAEAPAVEPTVRPIAATSDDLPNSSPARRPKPPAKKLASLGGIAVIAGGLAIMLFYGNSPPTAASLPEPRTPSPATENQLRALLAELKIDHAQLTRSEKGDWRLEGYVADAEQKRRLSAALQQRGLRVRLQVWSADELLESGRAVLNGLNLPLTVSYGSPGVLRLNGETRDQPSLTRAVETLRRDIPGLRELDNRATVAAGRTASAATNAGSAGGRTLSPAPATGAPRTPSPLAIKSVSLGAVRFIVTTDGAKYLEGASLGNGYVLKAIQDDGLILSDGDRDIIQDFGRSS